MKPWVYVLFCVCAFAVSNAYAFDDDEEDDELVVWVENGFNQASEIVTRCVEGAQGVARRCRDIFVTVKEAFNAEEQPDDMNADYGLMMLVATSFLWGPR